MDLFEYKVWIVLNCFQGFLLRNPIFPMIVSLLLFIGLIAASGLEKRIDGPSPLVGVWATLLNFDLNDFVQVEDPKMQLYYLDALVVYHPKIAEYIFTSLHKQQRSQILEYSNQFERFSMWSVLSLNGRAILLTIFPIDEVELLLESVDSQYITSIIEKYDEIDRYDLIKAMGPKVQVKWILGMSINQFRYYSGFFLSDQLIMQNLALEFTKFRFERNFDNKKLRQFSAFLDQLADYYTREEFEILKSSNDPIFYLARFSPKERESMLMFTTREEKEDLLKQKLESARQNFPTDFLFNDSDDLGYLADEDEWIAFWMKVEKDIEYQGKVAIGSRRRIFQDVKKIGRLIPESRASRNAAHQNQRLTHFRSHGNDVGSIQRVVRFS